MIPIRKLNEFSRTLKVRQGEEMTKSAKKKPRSKERGFFDYK